MKKISYALWTGSLLFLLVFAMGCAKQHTVHVHDTSLTFSYRAPDAEEVFFVSSADNFRYHAATRESKANWLITVPLQSELTYFYVVDGVVTLPDCPETVLDDFGGKNCFYEHGM